MKVVYNACYGGFSISNAAIARYWEIKNIEPPKDWYYRDIRRDDPALVQIVEELGQASWGSFARLVIEDIPKGQRWHINEYDGYETVMTVDDYGWSIAT